MNKRLSFFALFLAGLLILALSRDALAQNGPRLWFAEFWSNEQQEGEPVARHSTGLLNYDWGSGAPLDVPANHFSARWTTYAEFAPGTYRLTTVSDDGVRVWLEGQYVLDSWERHDSITNQVVVSLQGGLYPLAVDYFEAEGDASIRFTWERLGPPSAGAGVVVVDPAPAPATSGAPGDPLPESGVLATTQANLRLRQGPGTAYAILDVAPAGTTVPVLARNSANSWVQVRYQDQVGWMAAWHLHFSNVIQAVPVAG